jgi:hypothetical protein
MEKQATFILIILLVTFFFLWRYLYKKQSFINRVLNSNIEIEKILDKISMFVKSYNITVYESENLNAMFDNDEITFGNYKIRAYKCINPTLYFLSISFNNVQTSPFLFNNLKFKDSNSFLLKISVDENKYDIYTDNPCTTNEKMFLVKEMADEIAKYIRTRM